MDTKSVVGIIRATAYPYVENDTLKIELPIEFNLTPRAMEIAQVDTFWRTDSVFVERDIPFIEKPAVVASGTILGIAILYGIVESLKGLTD